MVEVKAISVQFDASLARVTLNPPQKNEIRRGNKHKGECNCLYLYEEIPV